MPSPLGTGPGVHYIRSVSFRSNGPKCRGNTMLRLLYQSVGRKLHCPIVCINSSHSCLYVFQLHRVSTAIHHYSAVQWQKEVSAMT